MFSSQVVRRGHLVVAERSLQLHLFAGQHVVVDDLGHGGTLDGGGEGGADGRLRPLGGRHAGQRLLGHQLYLELDLVLLWEMAAADSPPGQFPRNELS